MCDGGGSVVEVEQSAGYTSSRTERLRERGRLGMCSKRSSRLVSSRSMTSRGS